MTDTAKRTADGGIFESRLSRRIAEEISGGGPVTFERFIEHALYDPESGYYASGAAKIGKKGDFYTSPTAHRAFGETLARFIGRMRERIGPRGSGGKFTVLEVGGGNGRLALDILSALAETDVEYILVDPCGAQRCAASGRHANFRRAGSLSDIKEPVTGIILSNELFDAVPFNRLAFSGGRITETFVSVEGNRFAETEGAVSTERLVRYFDRCGGAGGMGFADGQRFEVSLGAGKMLEQMAGILEKGAVLTIDYGFETEELFSPARRAGSFKCVSGHRISESPFENIGKRDITAHVDFGNLKAAGAGSGLETLKYTTQGQFLVDWGITEIAERNPDDILAIKNLFMPGMMGDGFRVLLQTKNAGELKEGFYPDSPFRISFGIT